VRSRYLAPESWIAIGLVILAGVLGLFAYTASYWVVVLVYETAAIACLPVAALVWILGCRGAVGRVVARTALTCRCHHVNAVNRRWKRGSRS
jgi:hypothetical protein